MAGDPAIVGGRVAVVLVMAAACYAPRLSPGSPCETDSDCPTEYRCIGHACGGMLDADLPRPDARRDGSPDVDSDGDGIPDSLDNCPTVANADQFDEDTDGIGDACDRCPPVADPDDPDGDGDGVGDACDPRPTQSGDRWIVFEGFHGPISGWTVPSGWTVANDQLNTPPDVTTVGDATYPTTLTDAYVMTKVVFVDVDASSGVQYRSAGATTAVAGTNDYRCLLRDTSAAGTTNAGLTIDNTPGPTQTLNGVVKGATATLTLLDQGSALGCAGSTTDGRTWNVSDSDSTNGAGAAGVHIQNAVVSFDYVGIVAVGS